MQVKVGKRKTIIKFLVLFGMEFDTPHIGFISLRKIIFVMLLLYFLRSRNIQRNVRKSVLLATGAIMLLFVYGWCILRTRFGEYAQLPLEAYHLKEPILLMLNMIVFPVLLIRIFGDAEDFIRCQWWVILVQTAIVIIGKVIRPVRMFVFNYFAYEDGRLEEGVYKGWRSVGIDLAGASGSVMLLAGLLCGIYLFYQTKERERKKRIIIGWMLIMAANLFMGRTGLYFGGIALLMVLLDQICRSSSTVLWIMIGCIVVFAGCLIYVHCVPDTGGLKTWIGWVTEIGDLFGETQTIRAILNMNIPPLTLETLFGTGLYSGITRSGVSFSHDAGYIRAYTSIGLIGGVFYYGLIYTFYLQMISRVKSRKNRKIYFFFLLAIVILEMKEPFMAKTPLTMIMSCMLMLETWRTPVCSKAEINKEDMKIIS